MGLVGQRLEEGIKWEKEGNGAWERRGSRIKWERGMEGGEQIKV